MKRRFFAVALTAVVAAFTASPALAHQGNLNYRSEIDGIEPAVPGLEVQVLDYDDRLELENNTGKTVTVYGYQHDPYIRIAADGTVEVNHNSPAYYLNDDRYGNEAVPPGVTPTSPPDWQMLDKTGQYNWHDHRIHYMSTNTPAQVSDTSKKTKIFDYKVPVQVGRQKAAITGTLYWVGQAGGFPILPFAILGVVTLVAAAAIYIRRRRSSAPVTPTPAGPAEEAW